MKSWKQAREIYIKDHMAKTLTDHSIRLNALKRIEGIFSEKFSEPLYDKEVFQNVSKTYLMKLYECLKGYRLNSSEKSVFTGLYKFSK